MHSKQQRLLNKMQLQNSITDIWSILYTHNWIIQTIIIIIKINQIYIYIQYARYDDYDDTNTLSPSVNAFPQTPETTNYIYTK